MSLDRVYIRFKGRVLGPLTQEKTMDMVKRGQITRQHELSTDSVAWRAAGDFEEFFPKQTSSAKSQAEAIKKDELKVKEPAEIEWYANFDGANQGPINEAGLKKWIAMGKVDSSTLLWRAGMANWTEGGVLMPECFSGSDNRAASRKGRVEAVIANTGSASDSSSGDDLSGLTGLPLRTYGWVMFLAILGMILGVLGIIGSSISFVYIASSPVSGPPKAMAVIVSLSVIVAWSMFFYISFLLLMYGNKVSVLRFRATEQALADAFRALNRFWFILGLFVLVGLVLASLIWGAIVLVGASVASMAN